MLLYLFVLLAAREMLIASYTKNKKPIVFKI